MTTVFFKPSTETKFDDISCALTTTGPYFDKLREKSIIEICEWDDEPDLLKLVFVLFSSAKIYIGPKVVRVLKRLGNTGIKTLEKLESKLN